MTAFSAGATSGRPMGLAGRLAATLFFLFFLSIGFIFFWLLLSVTIQGVATWTWVKTECQVISSEVVKADQEGGNDGNFVLAVSYRYSYRGKAFTSQNLKRSKAVFRDLTEAARLAERYKAGTTVVCYVNAAAPSEAVLQRGSLLAPLAALFPLLFVAVGAGGIYWTWRRRTIPAPDARPLSDGPGLGGHSRVAWGFLLVFLLLGVGLLYPLFFRPVTRILAARNWPVVPCTVVSSEVKSHRGNKGNTYSVEVVYSYEYAGRLYQANRYDFMGGSSSGYSGKRAIVDRLPPGTKTLCYVNPRDPFEAVLQRGFTPTMWFGLIPLAFVLGAFFLLLKFRGGKRSPVSNRLGREAGDWCPEPGAAAYESSRSEPRVVKPQASPAKTLVFILVFALFWNGIIWIGLGSTIKGWHSSPIHWFLILFMVPFVLVGLALLGAVVYFLLALFNPRPQITITPGTVSLGDRLTIDWQLSGRTEKLQNLELRLQGREEATYRRGTDTVTDKNVFVDLPIATTTTPQEIRSGRGEVTIPAGLMHSFAGTHNKIIWSICIHGEIPRWPDLQEDFPVTVQPGHCTPNGER